MYASQVLPFHCKGTSPSSGHPMRNANPWRGAQEIGLAVLDTGGCWTESGDSGVLPIYATATQGRIIHDVFSVSSTWDAVLLTKAFAIDLQSSPWYRTPWMPTLRMTSGTPKIPQIEFCGTWDLKSRGPSKTALQCPRRSRCSWCSSMLEVGVGGLGRSWSSIKWESMCMNLKLKVVYVHIHMSLLVDACPTAGSIPEFCARVLSTKWCGIQLGKFKCWHINTYKLCGSVSLPSL